MDQVTYLFQRLIGKKLYIFFPGPSPRSACVMFPLPENKGIVIFGGYFKEKSKGAKKDSGETGKTLEDMYLLTPDSTYIS